MNGLPRSVMSQDLELGAADQQAVAVGDSVKIKYSLHLCSQTYPKVIITPHAVDWASPMAHTLADAPMPVCWSGCWTLGTQCPGPRHLQDQASRGVARGTVSAGHCGVAVSDPLSLMSAVLIPAKAQGCRSWHRVRRCGHEDRRSSLSGHPARVWIRITGQRAVLLYQHCFSRLICAVLNVSWGPLRQDHVIGGALMSVPAGATLLVEMLLYKVKFNQPAPAPAATAGPPPVAAPVTASAAPISDSTQLALGTASFTFASSS